jgi:hypothetical protein
MTTGIDIEAYKRHRVGVIRRERAKAAENVWAARRIYFNNPLNMKARDALVLAISNLEIADAFAEAWNI